MSFSYKCLTNQIVTMQQLENMALARWNTLKKIDSGYVKKYTPFYYARIEKLVQEITDSDFLTFLSLDLCSRFMGDFFRKWVIKTECDLMRFKLRNQTIENIVKLLELKVISDEEKREIMNELIQNYQTTEINLKMLIFYKVPFEACTNLVKFKNVIIKDGLAYVTADNLHDIFINDFKLKMELPLTSGINPRLTLVIDTLKSKMVSKIQSPTFGSTVINESSFPPCVVNIMSRQKDMTHDERRNIILFFKEAGVKVDHVIRCLGDKYSYNIRYNYGLINLDKNYRAPNCHKVITVLKKCPFFSDIEDSVSKCGIKCMKKIEASQGPQKSKMIRSPNQYYSLRESKVKK